MTIYKGKKIYKIVKVLKKIAIGLFFFFVALILSIRSPWGQDIIVNTITSYIADKTKTKVAIEKLYISFSGNVLLKGLYLEDKKGDTLVYSKYLEASLALIPLIRGREINIKSLDWDGLKAQVYRNDTINDYNFNFLVEAFASKDTIPSTEVSNPPKISLGQVNLSNFNIDFNDAVIGIESAVQFDNFSLRTNEIDVATMLFDIEEVELSDALINFKQTKTNPEDTSSTPSTALPIVKLEAFKIKNTTAYYTSLPEYLDAKVSIGDFFTEVPLINLGEQKIEIQDVVLANSDITIQNSAPKTENTTDTPIPFQWPQWFFKAQNIALSNNNITTTTGTTVAKSGEFNPEHLAIQKLGLQLKEVSYSPGDVNAVIQNISFYERSGFHLKTCSTHLEIKDTALSLANLKLATNNNILNGAISATYASIDKLIKNPEQSHIWISVPELSINPIDAFYFVPELQKNPYIDILAQKNINGAVQLRGTLDTLEIPLTHLTWGSSTRFAIDGTIRNLLEIEKLQVDIPHVNFISEKAAINAFINEETIGVTIPNTIQLDGAIVGGLNDFKGNVNLVIPEGVVRINGGFKNIDQIVFDGTIAVENLHLGKVLKNDKLGTYSFTSQLNGKGKNIHTLTGKLTSDFQKLEFNDYDFSNLELNGELQNGKGVVLLNFKDQYLDFDMTTNVQLDSIASKFHTALHLKGANFKALGLSEEDIRAKFKLTSDFEGNTSQFNVHGKFSEAVAIKNKNPYLLGDIQFSTAITEQMTSASIKSDPIDASLTSNTTPATLITALQAQLNRYFYDAKITDTITTTVATSETMKLEATIKQATILKELFLPQLESLDPVLMTVDFNAANSSLTTALTAPHIEYGGNTVDNLSFSVDANKEKLAFDFGLGNLSTDHIDIHTVAFKGTIKDKILYTDFNAIDTDTTLVHIASEIRKENDSILLHINPSDLIINTQNWTIPATNEIRYAKDFLGFKDFILSQNEQKIIVSTALPGKTKEHLGFSFSNFKLSTITDLFNSEKRIASGKLNGDFSIENPFSNAGIIADLSITELEALEVPLGTLSLEAKSIHPSAYTLNAGITGEHIHLTVNGTYKASSTNPKLDVDLILKNLELNALEKFSSTYISKTSGKLSGNLKLTGTLEKPKLLGAFHFNDSGVTINALNTGFLLPDESIKLDNNGIYFDSFTMLGSQKNPFVIDGKIDIKNLKKPIFALTLKAKNIQVLNSTKDDNPLFYGNVNLDSDVSISGTLDLPKVKGNLLINKTSDFTYIIPEDEVDIIEKEGVVLFVNKKNPDDILTQQAEDASSSAVLTGYDIDTRLSVEKKAVFNIIIDERTGDNLRVSGGGDFNFGISPNGTMSLSGKYEVNNGHYEVSLYNLVKRRFEIAKGSTIVWRGNPLEADMDIRAIYKIETATTGLMASQISGANSTVAGKYRQKMPFWVYLNLNGELLKPEISFDLDIPKDKQGELGGEVYSKVQQLNTQEEELNKQVFSLLVLNQFFPSTSNDGSSGGSLSIARDNVNNVLSDQLTTFSNKLLGNSGVELDVGIDSYTDYQGNAPQNKTQLDVSAKKQLFNDKLIVEVGSGVDIQENSQRTGQTTPLIGTVNLQYLFDKKGRWRLKGYRKNTFESVIDGQVIITGISLIFNQEFNKFKELFKKTVTEEVAKNKSQEETPTIEKTKQ
ncbi:translocation/assembly module TamB domain-containing protein [Aquimarina longa]|uniref:translocation/assembly module TamB domain-containing protein n=1 Tax=Aquimarina longa TaxID=1080221 RepID=UPI000B1E32CE|nr:translocation/assembly module TamB [Aquimarina longa]